ncbi:putative FBD-associated F-box protein At1g61330 [Lycium barbarum]|uniref:putative FBD-associated F-box protein At1g61330 n=1 Tax=Lycium barbarum TaxID=112863 RepID=UPI00293F7196|nr:putative FBD-associated F-box protein At1g61330 [Lycium barbarum]
METNRDDQSNNSSSVYLPNEVIHRIFTFLPIKHAISSSLVAKPFRNSWLYARNLCFDRAFWINCFMRDRDQISIMNNIISNHLGKRIHSFQLYIHEPIKYSSFFIAWIQLIASKGLEELKLHLVELDPTNEIYYHVPSAFINIKTLRILKLISCELHLPPKSKGLRFLKSLSLTKVRVVPYLIKRLFSRCVVLESLALEGCSFIGKVTIKGSNRFRTLLIRNCSDIILVTVNNPSINTFHYCGEINKIKFVDPISLKDVILNFGATTELQHIRERDNLMEALRNVQTLSIINVLLEGLSPRFVDFEYRDMEYYLPNLKELQLVRRGLSFINPWDILSFVKNCPQIERLFLDLGNYPMEAGSYWNLVAKEKFENCQAEFPQLKLLKVKGFKKLELEDKLVNFFLLHARFLESLIIVKSKKNHLEIKLSDTITVSKVVTISTYNHNKDESFAFPKHRVL